MKARVALIRGAGDIARTLSYLLHPIAGYTIIRQKASMKSRMIYLKSFLLLALLLTNPACSKHNPVSIPTPQNITIITNSFFDGGPTKGNIKYHIEGINGVYDGVISNGFAQRNDVLTGEYTIELNVNGANKNYIISVRKMKVEEGSDNRFIFKIPETYKLFEEPSKGYKITARQWHRLYTPEGYYSKLVNIENYYYWPKDLPSRYPKVWSYLMQWSNDIASATSGEINPNWKPYPDDNYNGSKPNSLLIEVRTYNASDVWTGPTCSSAGFTVDQWGDRLAEEATDVLLAGDNEDRTAGDASCLAANTRMTILDKRAVELNYKRVDQHRDWKVVVVGDTLKEIEK